MTGQTTRRLTTLAILACTALAAAGPGRGQEPPRTLSSAGSELDERISVELRAADVREVVASFAQLVQVEAEISPEVRGEVTIELHRVRVATALTAVCESSGCLWRIEDGRLKVVGDPEAPAEIRPAPGRAEGPSASRLRERIDLDLKEADLQQVLRAFGSIAEAEVEVDESLRGSVTVKLQNTPVSEALDALCRTHGCRWALLEAEAGPVLRFIPR